METNWFNQTVNDVILNLKTDIENGLESNEVKKRQEKYGLNELKAKKKKVLLLSF